MLIRRYTESDREKVLTLLRLNTPNYFSESEESDFIYYLDDHSENFYLIEEDDKILACGGFNLLNEGKLVRISWDIVHPSQQGKGLGTKLTKFRLEKIKTMKTVSIIEVRTSQFADKFYEQFGFVTKEVINDYWAKGFDLYRMDQTIS